MEQSAFGLFSRWWPKKYQELYKTNEDVSKHAELCYKNVHFSEYLICGLTQKWNPWKFLMNEYQLN